MCVCEGLVRAGYSCQSRAEEDEAEDEEEEEESFSRSSGSVSGSSVSFRGLRVFRVLCNRSELLPGGRVSMLTPR